jgi:lipopolysaccharide export system permease protein
VKEIDASGSVITRPLRAGDLELTDRPAVLANRRPHAEEFTFSELRDRIALLRAKGLNVDELLVDWHAKLAIPFSAIVSVLFGFPLAIRGGRRFGLGYNVGVGLITGFLYWATLAFAVSAGRIGVLPPVMAAWSANIVFGVVGAALLRKSD